MLYLGLFVDGLIMEQRTSSAVNWIGYLAATFLIALPLAVLTVRAGAWQQGLLLYAISCAGALILLLVSLVLLVLPGLREQRPAILKRSILTLPGTLLLLALLGSRGDYPPIHDITTDTQDPPVFSAAIERRGEGSNSLAIKPDTIEAQLASYPDIATMESPLTLEQAYKQALQSAESLGWEIYRDDLNAGYIEAVDSTAIMGFKDDVVIRVRTNADGTLIDLRSVSRVGVSDLGANAARIQRFFAKFNE